jgi:uncharacterized RDD family membrane protein YckC
VKCPKCEYLGFETGDRCKNCGYDFSLSPSLPAVPLFDVDLIRHPSEEVASELPLFLREEGDPDEPLVKLPAAPRIPLAVRRTPEIPKLRAVPKRVRPPDEPALQFQFTEVESHAPVEELIADVRQRSVERLAASVPHAEVGGVGARVAAVAIDHLLLCGIDLAVIYFTVRMTGLPMSGWSELPMAPLVVFLMMLKFSYFFVFTAAGGQTIGKMAMRLRVVTAEGGHLDAARSAVRAAAGTLSAAILGLGYLPAMFGEERRALHDQMARTRVVAVPPV